MAVVLSQWNIKYEILQTRFTSCSTIASSTCVGGPLMQLSFPRVFHPLIGKTTLPYQSPQFCLRCMRSQFLTKQTLHILREIRFLTCATVCLSERSGLRGCTANHISSPSEVIRCRDGLLYYSARLQCCLRQSESQWSLIQIEVYRCRWQCTTYMQRVPLQPQAASLG